jgi:hypothetical protein
MFDGAVVKKSYRRSRPLTAAHCKISTAGSRVAVPNPEPSRPWQEIARELARERDRKHLSELREELNSAVEEQGLSQNSK